MSEKVLGSRGWREYEVNITDAETEVMKMIVDGDSEQLFCY